MVGPCGKRCYHCIINAEKQDANYVLPVIWMAPKPVPEGQLVDLLLESCASQMCITFRDSFVETMFDVSAACLHSSEI